MKRIEFNHAAKEWDQYKAFHTSSYSSPFVEFETGEVMIRANITLRPHIRDVYDRYGITIAASDDWHCPQLHLDKECTQPVKKAWLNQGGHTLLAVDTEQKVAVPLEYFGRKNHVHLPKHLLWASAVWTGPDRDPTPLTKFKLSRPDAEARRGLKASLADVRAAARAAVRIGQLHSWWASALYVDAHMREMTTEELCAYVLADKDLTCRAAAYGFSHPRRITEHQYLYTT